MKHTTNPRYLQPITGQYRAVTSPHLNQEIMRCITSLITLGLNTINILIILRFMLDLRSVSLFNPFAQLIYSTSQPFISIFQGLTRSPALQSVSLELIALIAVSVYSLLSWSLNRLLRILFAK